jgi:hypothetical protein
MMSPHDWHSYYLRISTHVWPCGSVNLRLSLLPLDRLLTFQKLFLVANLSLSHLLLHAYATILESTTTTTTRKGVRLTEPSSFLVVILHEKRRSHGISQHCSNRRCHTMCIHYAHILYAVDILVDQN